MAGLFFIAGNYFSDNLRFEVIESVVVESVEPDGSEAQAIGIRVFEYSGWEFLWIYLVNGAFAYAGYLRLNQGSELSEFSKEVFKVKLGNKLHFLPFKDIEFIEASGNYIHVYSDKKKYTSRMAIQDLLNQADKSYLMRIHRSFAINVNQIRELVANGDGHVVVLTNGSEVKVGKNYKEALFSHLGIGKS